MTSYIKSSIGITLLTSLLVISLILINQSYQSLSTSSTFSSLITPHTQLAQLADVTSGLVAHWTFDGNTNDSAGTNNGTAYGSPIYSTGKINQALSFDGTSQYVSTPININTVSAGDITISIWANISNKASARFYSATDSGPSRFYLGPQGSTDTLILGLGSWNPIISSAFTVNTWTLYTVVLSGTTGYLYRNGSLIASQTGITVSNPGANLIMGKQVGTGLYYSGSLDDVRVYNRALSANEVSDLYAFGNNSGSSGGQNPTPVNGQCSQTLNQCSTGTFSDTADTSTNYQWSCAGSNGGIAASCTLPIPSTSTTTQTTTSGNIVTAATCSESDVQAAINQAQNGGIVNVPAGTCTWSSGYTFIDSKKIYLIGAGTSTTNITLQPGVTIDLGTSNSSISGFTFIGNNKATSGDVWFIVRGNGGWRINNNEFINRSVPLKNNICFWIRGGTGIPHPLGVIDHNHFVDCRPYVEGDLSNAFGSAIWSEPTNLGTNNAVFIEDNFFDYDLVQGNCIDSQYGGRYVARFNTVLGCPFEVHSTTNGHASRSWEIYDNTWIGTNNNNWIATFIRGGTGVIFGNNFPKGYINTITFDDARAGGQSGGGIWTPCNGTNQIDGNLITSGPGAGWPCRDQIGRGQDQFLFVAGSGNYPSQASEPVSIFLNRQVGNQANVSVVNTPPVGGAMSDYIADCRDYQNEKSNFNGSCGTGVGLLSSRPTTCTTGVYYWATDQGEWNSTHTGPDGQLYKCMSTNTWNLYYVPYQYPNPIITGSPVQSVYIPPVNTQTNSSNNTGNNTGGTTGVGNTNTGTSNTGGGTTGGASSGNTGASGGSSSNNGSSLPPTGNASSTPSTPCIQTILNSQNSTTFTRSLTLGSTGSDVQALQVFLNSHGFTVSTTGAGSKGNESTYFGPATQKALASYQVSKGITPAVGYFGPLTRASLDTTGSQTIPCTTVPITQTTTTQSSAASNTTSFTRSLTLGSTGSDVQQLQIYLNNHGYTISTTGPGSKGNESTYFGELTRQALAHYQSDHDINPPQGYFGPLTRAYISTH